MATGLEKSSAQEVAPPRVDGRRERGRSSHRRIVEAMMELITEEVMPVVMAPYPDQPWRDNVRELVRRRVGLFETTLPFRLAANIKRYQSPFLMGQYSRVVMLERELILRLLPAAVRADRIGVEALVAALSFHSWRTLRHDQSLSAEEAGTVMGRMVEAQMAAITAD